MALSYLDGGFAVGVDNAAPGVPVTGRGTPGGGARPDNGGTRGLGGLAERAQLLGGTLHAGPRLDGGFSVRAWLPTSQ